MYPYVLFVSTFCGQTAGLWGYTQQEALALVKEGRYKTLL